MKSPKSKINSLIKFDAAYTDNFIIGLDEAGRGPGAGDVFAAAAYFPEITRGLKKDLARLDDSKKISAKVREELAEVIKQNSVWHLATASVEEIEKINILQASLLAMRRAAVEVLSRVDAEKSPLLLIDGNKLIKDFDIAQKFVIKGDSLSVSIAAASIIAKTERDKYMMQLAEEFPQYDWQNNKGYLTPRHLRAIDEYGVTKYHRRSFLTKQLKFELK